MEIRDLFGFNFDELPWSYFFYVIDWQIYKCKHFDPSEGASSPVLGTQV